MSLREKALKIKAVVLDVDGVLTDGKIGYSQSNDEIKGFDVKDGFAINLALKAGFKVGILSGRESKANRIRGQELGLTFIYESEKNKNKGFDRLLIEHGLQDYECLYVGDDIIDIQVLKRAGVAVVPNDAVKELDNFYDFKTSACGGKGAVREAIVWLLKETGKWDSLIQKYL